MPEVETEEAMLARHKKEVKDLTGRITGMKKQANKNTRKEVLKKIKELEENLKLKHEKELEGLKNDVIGGNEIINEEENRNEKQANDDDDELTPEKLLAQLGLDKPEPEQESEVSVQNNQSLAATATGPKKKRNRQKERLAKREAEIKRIQEEAREEQSQQPDLRAIELRNLQDLCDLQKVTQYDITPDGHCLFSSISDQLKIRQGIETTVSELRKNAGDYIKQHPDDFIPFLFDEETMSLKNIDEYVDKLVNTAMWGGDLEILALSKVYDSPISVMMSGRAALKMNEEGGNPELKLVYYQHVFGLGEHYNSLHDA
jgi:OTU domain-containing protein 6